MRREYQIAERLLSVKRNLVAKSVNKIISDLKKINTITTTKLYLSKIRSVIKQKNKNHPALRYLNLSKKEYREINKEYHWRVAYRQTGRLIQLDSKAILGVANDLLTHIDDWRDLALALFLLTGRRPVEVLYYGSIKSSKFSGMVWFNGQAKTRNRPGTRTETYLIPVLTSANKVIKGWNTLRNLRVFLNAQQVNGAGGQIAARCQQRYGSNWTPRLLRAAYAAISFSRFAPINTSRSSYYATILGHKLHKEGTQDGQEGIPDIATALSYERFIVKRR